VKVDVHQHGVWGKRPTLLWGKKPSMRLFTLSSYLLKQKRKQQRKVGRLQAQFPLMVTGPAKYVGHLLLARDPLKNLYSLQFARNGPTTTVHQDLIGIYVTTES